MKPIQYIIQSYFQRGFHGVMTLIMSMIFLIAASLTMLLSTKENGVIYWFFLCSIILVSSVVVLYLREVTATDASALIPNYRKKQLIAAGIILTPFLLCPVVIACIKGVPVLSCLAMLLCIVSFFIFVVVNNIPDTLQMLVLIPLWLVYELLGLEPSLGFIGSFSEITGFGSDNLFALFVTGVSLALIGYFSVRFLRGNTKKPGDSDKAGIDPFTASYDKIDTISARLVFRKIDRLFNNLQKRKSSFSSYVRLYQYALFSPSSSLIFDMAFIFASVISYVVIVYFYVTNAGFNSVQKIAPLIFLIYHLGAVSFTTDFLQHRDRMPALWLQSRLSSRREVAKVILLTYLAVAGRQYLKITVLLLLLPLLIPAIANPEYIPVLSAGVLPFIVLISFSLILSDRITSFSCWGWSVSNTLLACLVLGMTFGICRIFYYSQPFWLFFLLITPFSLLFLWRAFNKWAETEMNFTGPEFSL